MSLYAFWHKKRKMKRLVELESDLMLPNMPYSNLAKATNGFSSENLIGNDTYGVVYKGTLE